MHPLRPRRPVTVVATGRASVPAALLLAVLAASIVAAPVLAKEGLQARLDAPIGIDTPPGTELLVGMTVSFPDGSIDRPVQGSPIYLRLIASDGTSTMAIGREDGPAGHYTVRIVVPDGGIAVVAVGIHGTSDLGIEVVGRELAAGGPGRGTAPVAPPIQALVPRALASAPAQAAPGGEPVGAAGTATSAATEPGASPVIPPAALLALVIAGLMVLAATAKLVAALGRPGRADARAGRPEGSA